MFIGAPFVVPVLLGEDQGRSGPLDVSTRSAFSCTMHRNRMPGIRFHDGRLMIFTDEETKIVHSWPDLEAVRKRTAKPRWKPFIARFRFLRPKTVAESESPDTALGPSGVRSQALDPAWEKLSAFMNFRRSIPQEIATVIECFPGRQMALLRMCW